MLLLYFLFLSFTHIWLCHSSLLPVVSVSPPPPPCFMHFTLFCSVLCMIQFPFTGESQFLFYTLLLFFLWFIMLKVWNCGNQLREDAKFYTRTFILHVKLNVPRPKKDQSMFLHIYSRLFFYMWFIRHSFLSKPFFKQILANLLQHLPDLWMIYADG